MIKAIVFDLGNVLYDLDFPLFRENLSALIDEKLDEHYEPFMRDLIYDYNQGLVNTETFIWRIQKYKNGSLNPRTIINSFNSLLIGFPAHKWDFLQEVRKKYKVFLLSNINEMHLEVAYKHIKNVHGKLDFETKYFDGVFYSHLVHMVKPMPEIYKLVEDVTHYSGDEILFIDDQKENIEAAIAGGWNAEWHDPTKDVSQEFKGYLEKYVG